VRLAAVAKGGPTRKAREAEADARKQRARCAAEMHSHRRSAACGQSGKLAQYIEVIRQKVERNWARPASAQQGLACDVYVSQIPGGEVVNVRVGTCNGDAAVVRSIEAAVQKASPLPPPPDPSLFERELLFKFVLGRRVLQRIGLYCDCVVPSLATLAHAELVITMQRRPGASRSPSCRSAGGAPCRRYCAGR
jgi:hypothetical protein